MDPVSAIVMATLSIGTSVIDLIAGNKAARYSRLPDWLSPKDFQQKSYTMEIIIIGLFVAIILVLGLTAWKARK